MKALLLLALVPFGAWAGGPTYAGSEACLACHREQANHYKGTPMAQALLPVAVCDILIRHPKMEFDQGSYHYEMRREGDSTIYTVTNGTEKFQVPLRYAFGLGQAGQTYLFEHDGVYFESRVSYYKAIDGLDVTIGAIGAKPINIEQAAGNRMNRRESEQCFGCHSMGAEHTPGVGCELCHGPAAKHIAAIRSGNAAEAKMKHLADLAAEDMSNLCGSCHRTWAQIAQNGPRGVNNVRFQPYRLANSKCYDSTDARISCIACHDAHSEIQRTASYYDSKCMACHSAAGRTVACKVAKSNCVTCHMPKVELPGGHHRFTDHEIRIARAGDPYPN